MKALGVRQIEELAKLAMLAKLAIWQCWWKWRIRVLVSSFQIFNSGFTNFATRKLNNEKL
jgi:hypothetical protein